MIYSFSLYLLFIIKIIEVHYSRQTKSSHRGCSERVEVRRFQSRVVYVFCSLIKGILELEEFCFFTLDRKLWKICIHIRLWKTCVLGRDGYVLDRGKREIVQFTIFVTVFFYWILNTRVTIFTKSTVFVYPSTPSLTVKNVLQNELSVT